MPRNTVPYSELVPNSSLPDPAGTPIDAAMVTSGVRIANAVPERTVIRVTNTHTAAHAVTVNAGDYPPAVAAGQGPLTRLVQAAGTELLGPFESGRFLQADGTLEVDFAAGHTGAITVFKVPAAC